ncbi:serine-protein kinase ATM-like [Ruditapes philippinarum]|uniref:serine-protein kinase ATM-like n=1 Tax=Ruditapes philippinarum TaxID=129788 RepID=UPI00295B9906|nr:serine-protein kinase ATM-like [Ruditapes philippinarum]
MTVWDNNFWLDVDYLQVAMAAQYCSAHFTALMFAEIWCDVQRERSESDRGSQRSSQGSSQDTRIDTLSEASSSRSGVSVQDLLLEAYSWIGDPDGVYGCGAGRKADSSSRICTYQQENQWDKAVVSCDIQMSQSGTTNQYDLLNVLQCFGANHIFNTYLQGIMGQDDVPNLTSETRELQFEAAWRMGMWNLDSPNKIETGTGFHESVFKAMKSIREDHSTFTDKSLNHARLCAVSRLKDGCLTSARKLYPVLADLMCVNIVNQTSDLLKSFREVGRMDLSDVNQILDSDSDIKFTLPTLYMKCSAVKLLWEKTDNKHVFRIYVESLHQLATSAREANRHQVSERAIATVKELDISDLSLSIPSQIEEAKLFWARGEENIAKPLLRGMIDKLRKLRSTDKSAAMYYPQTLSIYGNWLAETRSENPNIIMENYMEKAINMYEQLDETGDRSVDAYLALAKYADTQYQNIVNYMNSSTYEAKQSLMRKSQQEADRLREVMGESAKDRYLRTLEKQTEIDQHELLCMQEDRNIYLLKAVLNYIKCLRCGDEHNLRVFRLTSLWFNNVHNKDVNSMMEEAVNEIKTYKWLPLMYQLAARMDVKPHRDTSQPFLQILDKMIYETAVSHPHHTLFCVLALANANRDTELLQQAKTMRRSSKMSKSQADNPAEEGRVLAAKNMVGKLRENKKVGDIVKDLQTLCDAYIQLANWNVQEYKTQTKPIQLPAQLWLTKVRGLRNVPVPTKEIKVNASCDYRDIPHIEKFEPTFKLAGLGRDDLRQDAVMQQVFDMVNNLLQKDSETRKRQLQIRKYKVIPLSQRSGLLEWCEGTLPVGEYLVGSKGAHARYRPKDLYYIDCRTKLTAATTTEGKYKVYQEICEKFQPVFRHFFFEKFTSPPVWFERRLAYTRSVATNSIVGYILGLGDRHIQNILIDCNTAELVHIDLGIAFEQGKILPTPETVPFRLTRDIEDAMGASGVEGVFRRCCEKTMEVMRSNQEALLTILEVLLYDPLHVWTISPAKAYALQRQRGREESGDTVDVANTTADIIDLAESSTSRNSETQENLNKVAERVLLRLRQKLQGVEDGVQLSLSGQVNYLIQEARNPKNLARIFPGWQPYV